MGIVETLKRLSPAFACFGVGRLREVMGSGADLALAQAYGRGKADLLAAAFRLEDADLSRVLRTGVKVGFATCSDDVRRQIAADFRQDPERLAAAVAVDPNALPEPGSEADARLREARFALSQFELAVDTRIDAAVASSSDGYAGVMQFTAGAVAVAIALVAGALTLPDGADATRHMAAALAAGLVAVPIAPIAKDLAGALKQAASALKGRVA
jgi:hypothetical protein